MNQSHWTAGEQSEPTGVQSLLPSRAAVPGSHHARAGSAWQALSGTPNESGLLWALYVRSGLLQAV